MLNQVSSKEFLIDQTNAAKGLMCFCTDQAEVIHGGYEEKATLVDE